MKKPNILFLGTHGQKNWGDELLLEAFLVNFRDSANKFYVNSYDPDETSRLFKKFDITTFHTTKDILKLLLILSKCDILLFGGGNILKELHKDKISYSVLYKVLALVLLAKILRKKILISNIGIGPVKSNIGAQLCKVIIFLCDFISLRDSKSYNLVTQWKVNQKKIRQTNDIVFSLPDNILTNKKTVINNGKKIRVVINICRHINNENNYTYFIENFKQVISLLSELNNNIEFICLPMQILLPDNNDQEELQKLFSDSHLDFKFVLPDSLSEIADVIQSADLVISSRLHLVILSILFEKNIIALEYDKKVTHLLSDNGISAQGVQINKKFDTSEVASLILNSINNHTVNDRIKKIKAENYEDLHLYVSELKELIN
jgi:polysaccharide pyruvyl transferase CsaB